MGVKKILEMRSITKTFPGVKALDNVTFEAYSGEILALVGENGAGKSTLMKVLSGSYPATSYTGEIYVDGKKMHFMNAAQSESVGVAMIYQEISMHLDLSIAENIFLGRWHKSGALISWNDMNKEARKYLDMVHLDIDPALKIRMLGASQQQLVAIARALSKNPKILVLDEPTSPLTKAESENLFEILHELKNKGVAMILISHKMDEVFENSDRITVLRDGKTIATHNIDDVEANQIIAEMVGRNITEYYPKEKVKIGNIVMEAKNYTVQHPFAGNKNIVQNVSFNVRAGEILAFAGLVGSGRSESVNAVFGKIPKKSGNVYIDGKEIVVRSPKDAINAGIALVTEDRKADGLVLEHSIETNSVMVAMNKLFPSGFINYSKEKKESKKYFDAMKIKAPNMNTLTGQLSGGNQQKVVLAKWLMDEPKVLILDEPTRGIDVGAKAEIYRIMVDLAKQGVAIVMISSELSEVINMADRIIVLAEGKVRGEIIVDENTTQEQIMDLATNYKEA